MLMRGGTSKGAFFLEDDLPSDRARRDELLLQIVGSPDPRQIDGVGGAHPLTTKVAVVSGSNRPDVDVEYLFLQPGVGEATISDRQNCGNMLAAVGPFALERGLVSVDDGDASVRILMRNTGGVAVATFPVRGGRPVYSGDTTISGVPGTAARVLLEFVDTAGSTTGALMPTGNYRDSIDGIDVTLVDNGMPVVILRADALGITGYEGCQELEANTALRNRLEGIRLQSGPIMGLGDVADTTIPKLTLVAPPRSGGSLSTRTFIPHRCHDAIGALGAVSVATAAKLTGSVVADVAADTSDGPLVTLEHPTGTFDVSVVVRQDGSPTVEQSAIIRTARLLMDGTVHPRSY
ncbi:MAG: 4-oxalomesaconate tautomerase [Acidimicrobiia bacterium]|jgi:4-oxalomesaconate tautomerase